MSQEVMIAGALFSDVPSIRVPDSNGNFHPFTDVSDTTAAAADVATGKYFYAADGTRTAGTSSGGGGDFEHESGIYTATETAHEIRIPFAKTHLTPPAFVYVCKTDADTTLTDQYTQVTLLYINNKRLFGYGYKRAAATTWYGMVHTYYRVTSNYLTSATASLTKDDTNSSSSATTDSRFWVDESGFKVTTTLSSSMLEEGKSYQWIAVWPEA